MKKNEGDTYSVSQQLEPSQFGNTVMIIQKSNLQLSKTYKDYKCYRPVMGIYRKHCEMDLMEVGQLNEVAKKGVRVKRIDTKTLWAQYEDRILLDVLDGNLRLMPAIRDQLEALDLSDLEDTDGSEMQHPDLRRLCDILTRKTITEVKDGESVAIHSYLSMNLENTSLRDAILKIGCISPDFSILDFFSDQEDFQKMIKSATPQTTIELDSCFRETRSTRLVQNLEWPRDLNLLTLLSDQCIITTEEINAKLKGKENRVTRAVNVQTINLQWLFKNRKNFTAFTKMLQGLPNKVYGTLFIESLLDQFWS